MAPHHFSWSIGSEFWPRSTEREPWLSSAGDMAGPDCIRFSSRRRGGCRSPSDQDGTTAVTRPYCSRRGPRWLSRGFSRARPQWPTGGPAGSRMGRREQLKAGGRVNWWNATWAAHTGVPPCWRNLFLDDSLESHGPRHDDPESKCRHQYVGPVAMNCDAKVGDSTTSRQLSGQRLP
jgi:hypothetical protein